MKNEIYAYETAKVGPYTVKVVQDDDPMNPRKDYDHLGRMVCFHRRYNLGDKHSFDIESAKEFRKQKNVYSLPLYLYDHSGITMRTGPFSCPWDSGCVGFIYIERETFLKEFGYKKMTKKVKEHLYKVLEAEVEEYDNYLTGEVYGYIVETEDGEFVDSCYGYFGDTKYCLNEGIQSAQYEMKRGIKRHIEQVKVWIRHRVPLIYRTPLLF